MASFLPEVTIRRTIHGRKGKQPDHFMKSGHNVFFQFTLEVTFALKQLVFLIPTEEKVNCKKTSGKQGTKIS